VRRGLQQDYISSTVKSFDREFSAYVANKVREDTILGRIPHVAHAHGERTTSTDLNGYVRTSSREPLLLSGVFSIESLENGRGPDLQREISATMVRAREAIVRAFYDQVGKICEESGQVIDGASFESTMETSLQMIEKLNISFVEGRIRMPEMHATPDVIERFEKLQDDPVFKLRVEAILMNKWFRKFELK
jgi:hypothetical protein